ncbi:hypothetical protein SLNWT_6798 [Streptomyces albus]|uniref:Uncharacterized protein n=1 Tax=Streptomyces albus (strain ATCC 21838 / DSM 41398 / FERM P-419 / JCM 4703 / NBRC 107858) TaxID=1081613 RepID=A0A0B5EZD4_STRA4|nr:hypothetical protein SLNWT_6798 [Streptomyces albus]
MGDAAPAGWRGAADPGAREGRGARTAAVRGRVALHRAGRGGLGPDGPARGA